MKDTYGKKWQVGDVVGVFLDTNDRTIVFSLNGELLVDPSAGDAAFTEILGESFVPACTLGIGQKCRHVSHRVITLKTAKSGNTALGKRVAVANANIITVGNKQIA